MLKTEKLNMSFDGINAVQDVSLCIEPEKITSLIGPNGAGKTTLFNIITGFLRPDSGQVLFAGNQLRDIAPWKISRMGVSRTFQNLRLFRKLTVLENIMLGIKDQRGDRFLYALTRFSPTSSEHTTNVKRAIDLGEFVGLTQHNDELADNLSYGQQKLLTIACCLAGNPDLLLLDEPVAGVQPEMIKKIEGLLKHLVYGQKKTVFLIEHDMDFVLRISDTVVIMDDGRKVLEDTPSAIKSDPRVLETYLT